MAAAHFQTQDVGTGERGLPPTGPTTSSQQMLRPMSTLPVAPISGPGDFDNDRESDVGEATLGDSNVGGLGVAVCITDPLTSRAAGVERPVVPGTSLSSWAVARQDTSSGKIAGLRAQEPLVHTPPASIALESAGRVWPEKPRVLPQASTDHPDTSGSGLNVFSSSSIDGRSADDDSGVRNRADKTAAVPSRPIQEPTQESDSGGDIIGTPPNHSVDQYLPTTCPPSVDEVSVQRLSTPSARGAARSSSPAPAASPSSRREERDGSSNPEVATTLLHGATRPSDRRRAPSSVLSIKSGIMGRDDDGTFQRERTHPLVGTAQLRKTVHDLEEELQYLTPHNRQHISMSASPSLHAQKPVGSVDPGEPTTCTGDATEVGTSHFVELLDQSTPTGDPADTLSHSPSHRSPSSHSSESDVSNGGMTRVSLGDRIRGEAKVIAGKVKRDPAKIAQGRALMSGDH